MKTALGRLGRARSWEETGEDARSLEFPHAAVDALGPSFRDALEGAIVKEPTAFRCAGGAGLMGAAGPRVVCAEN